MLGKYLHIIQLMLISTPNRVVQVIVPPRNTQGLKSVIAMWICPYYNPLLAQERKQILVDISHSRKSPRILEFPKIPHSHALAYYALLHEYRGS